MKDMVEKAEHKTYSYRMHVYTCKACRAVIARTEAPMSEEGMVSKMRVHKCVHPGKQDFEMELR